MKHKPGVSFDETRQKALKDPEMATSYLEECLARKQGPAKQPFG